MYLIYELSKCCEIRHSVLVLGGSYTCSISAGDPALLSRDDRLALMQKALWSDHGTMVNTTKACLWQWSGRTDEGTIEKKKPNTPHNHLLAKIQCNGTFSYNLPPSCFITKQSLVAQRSVLSCSKYQILLTGRLMYVSLSNSFNYSIEVNSIFLKKDHQLLPFAIFYCNKPGSPTKRMTMPTEFPYQSHLPLESFSPVHQDRCQGSVWSQSRSAPTGRCSPCWSWAAPRGWRARRALPAVVSQSLGFVPSPGLQKQERIKHIHVMIHTASPVTLRSRCTVTARGAETSRFTTVQMPNADKASKNNSTWGKIQHIAKLLWNIIISIIVIWLTQ